MQQAKGGGGGEGGRKQLQYQLHVIVNESVHAHCIVVTIALFFLQGNLARYPYF